MNAYELAKEIDACFTKADWNVLEAANMLREQADKLKKYELRNQEQVKRIAELESSIKAKNNYLAQHSGMIDEQQKEIKNLEDSLKNALIYIDNHKQTKPSPDGLTDPKSYYQGYEDGVQSLTVTDPRPVAFMKDFGGFTDDPVLATQDGFNFPMYVTKADYQKIKQKKPYDAPQTKPLTNDEIWDIIDNWEFRQDIAPKENMFLLARAIESKVRGQ